MPRRKSKSGSPSLPDDVLALRVAKALYAITITGRPETDISTVEVEWDEYDEGLTEQCVKDAVFLLDYIKGFQK